MREGRSPRIAEAQLVVGKPLDAVAALVHEPVMAPAEQHEVLEARLAAAAPVADVMRIDEEPVLTAREAAAAVAPLQRPSYRRRDGAGLPADGERLPVPFPHTDDRRVAGKPPARLRRERWPIVELANSLPALAEDAFVDVHDHLLPFAAGA
jgi:hypothetical protein